MGLDITVMIADWGWLGDVPPPERLARLRDAWYADETGLWDFDAPPVTDDWQWPQGPDAASFAVYDFPHTAGSFKAHFWAGQRWECLRGHAGPEARTDLDALLLGLIWDGPDGEAQHTDPGFFSDDPRISYGLLVARSPDRVRELASAWERSRPRLGGLHEAFTEHAAVPGAWVGEFHAFVGLLEGWGRVLDEASRRGWGVVGVSE
ncbi:hypothetical protein [Streptomyces cyaneofuscatus]|uniref:hypothetical protein n=1 Tax=Streptomyces cyaneofuscatus TaxID=66883 RepID=UPI0033AC59AB